MNKTKFLAAAALAAVFAAADLGSASAQALTPDQKVQQYDLTEQNKHLVTTAYQALFGDHDLTALDRYWADTYIQHNPYMSDGREGVKQALPMLRPLSRLALTVCLRARPRPVANFTMSFAHSATRQRSDT
jgi:hypothetical protein